MGKGPGFFSDIGKKAKDLLTKDYSQDQKFSINTETDSGLVLSTSSVRKGDLLSGDVILKFKAKNTITDIKVDTSSNIHTTITADEVASGLKTILSFTFPDTSSGKLELQYSFEHASIGSSFAMKTNPVIDCNVAFGGEGFSIGAEAAFDSSSNTLTKYNGGLGLIKPEFSAALLILDKGETLKASYLRNVDPSTGLAVAGEILHKLPTKDTTFTVGASYSFDRLTVVKTRLNNHGKLGALLQHEFKPKSTVIISSEIDTKALDRHAKIGLALALKP